MHDCDLYVTPFRIGRDPGIPPPHEVLKYHVADLIIPRAINVAVALASAEVIWNDVGRDFSPLAYRQQVRDLGYMYMRSKTHGALLADDLKAFFGESYLEKYGCSFGTARKGRWPARLLYASGHHATTFKHILLRVFLDSNPSPSCTRVEFEERKKPKPRDWKQIENDAITCMTAEVARHKSSGTRINLGDLYDLAHVSSIVRVNRHQVPRLMAWIENFKISPQSARVPGRRPRT